MFDLLKAFIQQIGKYSFEKINQTHQIDFKENHDALLSIVTEVDLYNSQAFKDFVHEHFSDLNHIIIDEESIDTLDGKLLEKIAASEYQFILDPVDGTLNYSSGLPFYGVLLAVFKKGQPLYGFIYAPALDEFLYTDGVQVFREHFGQKQIIKTPLSRISRVILAHLWQVKLKPNHTKGKFIVEDYFSAAICFLYLSLGQVKAVVAAPKLWDIAPFMAISKVLGMGLYDYHSGAPINLTPRYFSNTGKLKNITIMGFQDELSDVRDVFEHVSPE